MTTSGHVADAHGRTVCCGLSHVARDLMSLDFYSVTVLLTFPRASRLTTFFASSFVMRRRVALFTCLAELCAHLASFADFLKRVPQWWFAAASHSSHRGVRTPLRISLLISCMFFGKSSKQWVPLSASFPLLAISTKLSCSVSLGVLSKLLLS